MCFGYFQCLIGLLIFWSAANQTIITKSLVFTDLCVSRFKDKSSPTQIQEMLSITADLCEAA